MTKSDKQERLETGQVSETKLIQRAQKGDQAAFGELYDRYVDRVYRMVSLRVSDEMVAEDLTSEVFMKAWDNLKGYRHQGYSFGAWLFRIARNAITDHYRTDRPAAPLELVEGTSDQADVEKQVRLAELSESLKSRLEALTLEQRSVLELKFLMGMSTGEVAAALGKKKGAVRALQMRALQSMAQTMGVQRD